MVIALLFFYSILVRATDRNNDNENFFFYFFCHDQSMVPREMSEVYFQERLHSDCDPRILFLHCRQRCFLHNCEKYLHNWYVRTQYVRYCYCLYSGDESSIRIVALSISILLFLSLIHIA